MIRCLFRKGVPAVAVVPVQVFIISMFQIFTITVDPLPHNNAALETAEKRRYWTGGRWLTLSRLL